DHTGARTRWWGESRGHASGLLADVRHNPSGTATDPQDGRDLGDHRHRDRGARRRLLSRLSDRLPRQRLAREAKTIVWRSRMPKRILIAGGGYVGLYTALQLQKNMQPGEVEVTVVNPENFMVYR